MVAAKVTNKLVVCLEICAHLRINLFTIPYPGKGGVASKPHASKTAQSNNHGSKPKVFKRLIKALILR
ncbi:hypothetical protein EVAR_73802_1 [Eumeta japonica]|uniref:Uncharacterized protein n=1 Tax=Eumeta variegata TaxID=151549 RepID=A0A4C1SF92_EUMVA|nr:hypothetical protein EVAR_73802_1 [Eumeta japonica]